MTLRDFEADLRWSMRQEADQRWRRVYSVLWPQSLVSDPVTSLPSQRRGIDRNVKIIGGPQLLIDEKEQRRSYDTLFLERWSAWYGDGDARNRVGWAWDRTKVCDYVLYMMPDGVVPLPHALLVSTCIRLGDAIGPKRTSPNSSHGGYLTVGHVVTITRLAQLMIGKIEV